MKRSIIISIFSLGLAVGCVVATVSRPFVVAPARAGTNPQKWEYYCIDRTKTVSIVKDSNTLGSEGWEMTGVAALARGEANEAFTRMVWCFKRPLP